MRSSASAFGGPRLRRAERCGGTECVGFDLHPWASTWARLELAVFGLMASVTYGSILAGIVAKLRVGLDARRQAETESAAA